MNISEIQAANERTGGFFFSPDTMRFFHSRILPGVIGGRFFITSEQFVPYDGTPAARRYTVRRADDDGGINTVGEFQAYYTEAGARSAARLHAADNFGAPVGL